MSAPPESAPAGSSAAEPVSRGRAYYALGLLLVVYVFNFIDRSILAILLEPIREEFQVSDTYLGFLSGIAFAAFYTIITASAGATAGKGMPSQANPIDPQSTTPTRTSRHGCGSSIELLSPRPIICRAPRRPGTWTPRLHG